MDKKGVFDLDTTKIVLGTILIIAVLAVVMFLAIGAIGDTVGRTTTLTGGQINNETSTAANATGFYLSQNTARECGSTILFVTNQSSGELISSGNYTLSGCFINASTATADDALQGLWNISYVWTYTAESSTGHIINNVSVGASKFFQYAPTIFILLAVVVIISIISLVLIVVSKFGMPGNIRTSEL